MAELSDVMWRKSSRSSGNGGNCVEVSRTGLVRDSKNPGPVLPVSVPALVAVVKTGRLG